MMKDDTAIPALYEAAQAARGNAYSPYSGVKVGASLLDENGDIYSGCNVESASYGLTQCAERNALATALGAGVKPGSVRTMLIVATGFDVVAPCGACRQVMSELMAKDALVITCNDKEEYKRWTIAELLPDSFVLES